MGKGRGNKARDCYLLTSYWFKIFSWWRPYNIENDMDLIKIWRRVYIKEESIDNNIVCCNKRREDTMFARKDWFVWEQLCKYTSDWPHIDWSEREVPQWNSKQSWQLSIKLTGFKISFWIEHDLWCSVPASGHVLCENTFMIVSRISNACQSKVTNLISTHIHPYQSVHLIQRVSVPSSHTLCWAEYWMALSLCVKH